ncbi:hypothetical protein J6590_059178 [Homalodisca vitripennis]|nr:hypothetical protein J6590_059178 [Homalodisca vitripennis]
MSNISNDILCGRPRFLCSQLWVNYRDRFTLTLTIDKSVRTAGPGHVTLGVCQQRHIANCSSNNPIPLYRPQSTLTDHNSSDSVTPPRYYLRTDNRDSRTVRYTAAAAHLHLIGSSHTVGPPWFKGHEHYSRRTEHYPAGAPLTSTEAAATPRAAVETPHLASSCLVKL